MLIELLCDNCRTCRIQKTNIEFAMKGRTLPATLELVADPERFISYGLMSLPAIAIDGVLKTQGRLISKKELLAMLADS